MKTKNKQIPALLLLTLSLHAQEEKAIITYDVGSFTITLFSEGQQEGKTAILMNATEEMLKQTAPEGTFPMATNVFLVETGKKTILFDAGYGRHLSDHLKAYKKEPEKIDLILLTHMHGDHIGGLLRDNQKMFPSATLYIPRPEHDYWMSDEEMKKVPDSRRGGFLHARKVIAAYQDRLHLFTPGSMDQPAELLPGISGIAAYGHTPGHTGYLLESDGSKLFIWGDLTHAMAIQMPYPAVAVTYDLDPVQATDSRQRLLRYVSDKAIRIAGMHIQYPAIGHVQEDKSTAGYRFTLLCECEGR
jgi:glyoxylase-like metal-dependent hydrolase (beta-lactamase superfamily II)